MVLYVIFKSLINFELIFIYGVWLRPMFFFFVYGCPIAPATFVSKTMFLLLNCFYTSGKNQLGVSDGSVSEPRTQNNF